MGWGRRRGGALGVVRPSLDYLSSSDYNLADSELQKRCWPETADTDPARTRAAPQAPNKALPLHVQWSS